MNNNQHKYFKPVIKFVLFGAMILVATFIAVYIFDALQLNHRLQQAVVQNQASDALITLQQQGNSLQNLAVFSATFILIILGGFIYSEIASKHNKGQNDYINPETGLYSHELMHIFLNHELDLAQRMHTNATVLLIHLDQYQQLLSMHKTPAREALVYTAQLLQHQTRKGDYIFHLTDQYFLAYLSNCKTHHTINTAERFRDAIDFLPLHYKGKAIKLSVSVGIATSSEVFELETLQNMAHQALDHCLAQGGNCIELYKPSCPPAVDRPKHD